MGVGGELENMRTQHPSTIMVGGGGGIKEPAGTTLIQKRWVDVRWYKKVSGSGKGVVDSGPMAG